VFSFSIASVIILATSLLAITLIPLHAGPLSGPLTLDHPLSCELDWIASVENLRRQAPDPDLGSTALAGAADRLGRALMLPAAPIIPALMVFS
jgi:hypothetical protein